MDLLSGRGRRWALVGLAAGWMILVGCGDQDGGPGVYPARGTVESVDRESAQVLIDHEDVPGLMPAMTMNFTVPDEAVLARIASGQIIDFELRFTGRSYEVEGFEVIGEAPASEGWRELGDALVRTSPAPPFDLIDQTGERLRSQDIADRIWIVDFIYTECPGPCPIQTAARVALQKRVPESLRDRVRFLSFSLDPETDRPAKLRAYAEARGADLTNWSFLTGDRETLAGIVLAWGVGSVRKEDGSIDHTLLTFLVNGGRIYDRYTMKPGADDALLEDLVSLAGASEPAG